MAFNNAIPAADDRIRDSQADLLANFQAIQAFLEVNHILGTFDSPVVGNTGKHSIIQMPENGGTPATAANEGAIFCDEGPISTVTELFFRRENNGNSRAITEFRNYTAGGDDGYVYLGGGNILARFNRDVYSDEELIAFTGNPGPAFTNVPLIFVSIGGTAFADLSVQAAGANTITVNGFTLDLKRYSAMTDQFQSDTDTVAWLAIGTI